MTVALLRQISRRVASSVSEPGAPYGFLAHVASTGMPGDLLYLQWSHASLLRKASPFFWTTPCLTTHKSRQAGGLWVAPPRTPSAQHSNTSRIEYVSQPLTIKSFSGVSN